jgi:energy-coupling factor transporter ATP-binding protein EcfA2
METKHDILVQNKREVQFKLSINRKFTIIRGDSATGKTTLFQMVSDASSSRTTGVNISCDVPVIALYETGYKYELENESGKIYVIDEDFSALRTKEFATLALKSDNCFIIITRESMPSIPYSYKEIYQIKTSGKFHSLERIYEDYE